MMEESILISSYSRAQAIADGVLVDITDYASEAGFRWPVAITDTAYNAYIVPSPDLIAQGQSIKGRLWDLFTMIRKSIKQCPDSSILEFSVLFLLTPDAQPELISLKSIAGPGDDASPVITIMLPTED